MSCKETADKRSRYNDPKIDKSLRIGKYKKTGQANGASHPVSFGTITDEAGNPIQAVLKEIPRSEIDREVFAQWLNETYKLGVRMPRVVVRDAFTDNAKLMSARAPGQVMESVMKGSYDDLDEALAILKDVPVADRQAMTLFDDIIGNVDRHTGNFMLTTDHHLVAIDHGLTFQNYRDPDWVYDHFIARSLTDAQRVLTPTMKANLTRLVKNEKKIRDYWVNRPNIAYGAQIVAKEEMDVLFARIRGILKRGETAAEVI